MAAKTIDEILKQTQIHQILRPKLVMGTPNTSLKDVLEHMHHEKSGYIVLADEHSHFSGLFTERGVLMKVLNKGVSLSDPVSKYMRTDVPMLTKSDTVSAAIDAMYEFNVRHVPLADEYGQVCGILSIRTVVNFLAELFPTEIFNLPPRANQIHETVEGG